MLTSKQRAQLRAMANGFDSILQVGKGGIGDTLIKQVDDALTARELIKMTVLETSPDSARDAANILCDFVKADVVQVVGRKIILYRENSEEKKIILKK